MTDHSLQSAVLDTIKAEMAADGLVNLRVSGLCMEPVISNRSALQITRSGRCRCGDIIVYQCPWQNRNLVHRYLGRVPGSGRWKYLLKPDNGRKADTLVDAEFLLGRVSTIDGAAVRISLFQRFQSQTWYFRAVLSMIWNKLTGKTGAA